MAVADEDTSPPLSAFHRLGKRYLLITNVPHFVDAQGKVWLERAWHHDVVRHLTYLPLLKIASPALPAEAYRHEDLLPLEDAAEHFVALPGQPSFVRSLLALPKTAWRVFHAVGDAEIVHSGVIGWPYPLGWLGTGFAKLRDRRLVIVVESAPWRIHASQNRKSPVKLLRALCYEHFARWSCELADLALFTQPTYRETLLRGPRSAAYVTPATWINAENVLSERRARELWQEKDAAPARFLFAGRLLPEKGIEVMLEALRLLDRRGLGARVDVIGSGDCESQIDRQAAQMRHVQLRRLKPISYGPEFFSLLDGYHAVLVPSLGDEQPRIFFDAAARAVPAIASDTDGLRPHVIHRRTGLAFPVGDARALADTIAEVVPDPALLGKLGLEALAIARKQTHAAMHAQRSHLLAQHVG